MHVAYSACRAQCLCVKGLLQIDGLEKDASLDSKKVRMYLCTCICVHVCVRVSVGLCVCASALVKRKT